MVKLFEHTHTYRHPWAVVSSAFWKKYPNPAYPHVLEIDAFQRSLNPETGDLKTHRLMSADTNFPAFLNSMGAPRNAFALEESVVNARQQKLVLRSRNLTGSDFLVVEETCTYTTHPDNPDWTLYKQQATITGTAPLFSSKFESHGLSRLQRQAKHGLEEMEKICQTMTNEVEIFASEAMNELENLIHDVETGFSQLFSDSTKGEDSKDGAGSGGDAASPPDDSLPKQSPP